MGIATYPQTGGQFDLKGSFRLVVSTGAVTTVAARTASAGHIFAWRRASTASTQLAIGYVGAKFTLTTAYGTAQETGLDMIVARAYSAAHTGATAIDMGSTVVDTGALMSGFSPTIMATADIVRVADTGALTAGTHTLDANPIGILSDWSGAIGATVPSGSSGARAGFGTVFGRSRADGGNPDPLVLGASEGFVLRNLILMGATGVGRWDICVEWDEATPRS